MEQETYNLLTAFTGIVALIVTIAGLYGLYIQIRKLRESVWSATHSKLCDQSLELLKFFSTIPGSYDYFYHKKTLTEDAAEKASILYATEALANFLEQLVLQKKNLPAKQWDVWERFIHTTFKYSVVVMDFIQQNREWYSTELLIIADDCKFKYI